MTDVLTSNEWTKRSAAPGTLRVPTIERGEMPHGCNGGIHIRRAGASIAAPAQLQQLRDARGRDT